MAKKKITYPTICMGTKGDLVVQLQQLLGRWGSKIRPSGHFDIGTRSALVKFQKENGVKADGVCGPETWAELMKLAKIKVVEPAEEATKAEEKKELTLEEKVEILWKEHLDKKSK